MEFKNYCIIVFGNVTNCKSEISNISERIVGFIDQPGIVICTFTSVATLKELESYFTLYERNFILHVQTEETSGYNINNKTLEETLFNHLNTLDTKKLDDKTSKLLEIIKASTSLKPTSGTTTQKIEIPTLRIKLKEKIIEPEFRFIIPTTTTQKEIKTKIDFLLDKGIENLNPGERIYLQRLTKVLKIDR